MKWERERKTNLYFPFSFIKYITTTNRFKHRRHHHHRCNLIGMSRNDFTVSFCSFDCGLTIKKNTKKMISNNGLISDTSFFQIAFHIHIYFLIDWIESMADTDQYLNKMGFSFPLTFLSSMFVCFLFLFFAKNIKIKILCIINCCIENETREEKNVEKKSSFWKWFKMKIYFEASEIFENQSCVPILFIKSYFFPFFVQTFFFSFTSTKSSWTCFVTYW